MYISRNTAQSDWNKIYLFIGMNLWVSTDCHGILFELRGNYRELKFFNIYRLKIL